jgi:hypothetical protein
MDHSREDILGCVLSFLKAARTATLSQILVEVNEKLGIEKQNALLYAAVALNRLMDEGIIREYDPCPSEDANHYAWCLSND